MGWYVLLGVFLAGAMVGILIMALFDDLHDDQALTDQERDE